MALLSALSELDAVNGMLTSIGQAPVSTLAVSGIKDVNVARDMLKSVAREVQLHGFAFNTDDAYELSPDIDGIIWVPDGVLRMDPSDRTQNLVQRKHPDGEWAIWDSANLTWELSEPVKFRIVWAYAFDDLPATARQFVALAAARRFQRHVIGSNELDGFQADDENRAWVALLRDERSVRDTNMFRASATLQRVYNRSRYRGPSFP